MSNIILECNKSPGKQSLIRHMSDEWRKSGISSGDIILIHSSIKRLLLKFRMARCRITPNDVLTSFMDVVGAKGTILLPLFNFDFTLGFDFDIRNTPSHMGALTEAARLHDECVRTGHPVYSFAVIGHRSVDFVNIDNRSAYSVESPFGLLKSMNGKIACLDLMDQHSMTFYHHVEEVKKVEYRYFKSFRGRYIDKNGHLQIKEYEIYVRDLEKGVITHVNPAGELMWEAGIYRGFRPNVQSGLRVVNSVDMFNFVENIIDSGKSLGLLYRYRGGI